MGRNSTDGLDVRCSDDRFVNGQGSLAMRYVNLGEKANAGVYLRQLGCTAVDWWSLTGVALTCLSMYAAEAGRGWPNTTAKITLANGHITHCLTTQVCSIKRVF